MGTDDHAIVVGISRYPSLEDLGGPENDARAVIEWLSDPHGGDVPKSQIYPIRSADFPAEVRPTAEDVYRAFDKLIDLAEAQQPPQPAGRRLYIFMAGHGFGPKLREAALLMANAAPRRWGYSVSGGAVADHFGKAAYFREIVLLMDCCRDALAETQFNGLPWQAITGNGRDEPRWLYGFATGFSRKARERPIEGEMRGIFTVAVLEALRSGARTSSALKDLVSARMGELMDHDDYQRPYFQPSPDELEFGPPAVKPTLSITLNSDVGEALDAGAAMVVVGRGGTAPPVDRRVVKRGETWRVELESGLYEIRREDTGRSSIVRVTVGNLDIEI